MEEARRNSHLQQALEEEKRQGQKIGVIARTAALLVVAVMLPFINPNWDVLYYEVLLILFILLGLAQLRIARVGHSRLELAFIFLDLLLLAITLLMPNPFLAESWPSATYYRFEGFSYFYVLLAVGTLAYSWRTVMAFATWVPVIWLAGMLLIIWYGHLVPALTEGIYTLFTGYERLAPLYDPNNVNVMGRIQEVVIFFLVASILGLKSLRSNQLLLRQARIAAERANLSRYFPPTLVDDLANHDEPLGEVRSQEVAVLFADIVGFTRMVEARSPDDVVAVLRRFHATLEDAVFANGGTLDKYLGDGIMATFGTPRRGDRDATNALRAARAMHESIDRWNGERKKIGDRPIKLSVGINYGPVVLGDIGTERRLEFAALGDTVNVASRLEHATRKLRCRIVVSRSLFDHIRVENAELPLLADMSAHASLKIRGRAQTVDVMTC